MNAREAENMFLVGPTAVVHPGTSLGVEREEDLHIKGKEVVIYQEICWDEFHAKKSMGKKEDLRKLHKIIKPLAKKKLKRYNHFNSPQMSLLHLMNLSSKRPQSEFRLTQLNGLWWLALISHWVIN